jgi:hypothetical protein
VFGEEGGLVKTWPGDDKDADLEVVQVENREHQNKSSRL